MDRTTIIRGPAIIEYTPASGSVQYSYSQGDVKVTVGFQTFEVKTSPFGDVQERVQQRTATVEYTPVGDIAAATSINYWTAYGALLSGAPMLSTLGDANLAIYSINDGTKTTVYNVAITKIPELMLSTTKTVAGSVTFTGLGKGLPTLVDQGTANSFVYVQKSQALPSISFDPSNVITEPYTASIVGASSPWNVMNTTNGWQCTFDLNLQPVTVDSFGIVDWTVGNVKATARGQIIGVSESDVLDATTGLVKVDVARGHALTYNDLTITGQTPHVTVELKSAAVKVIPMQYGTATLRLADVEFSGVRTITSGTINPVFSVTIA